MNNGDVKLLGRKYSDRQRYALDAIDSPFYRLGKFALGMPAVDSKLGADRDAANFCRDLGYSFKGSTQENVNSLGGVVVPEEIADTILTIRERYGRFRPNTRTVPSLLGGRSTVPRSTGGVTATWVGEAVAPPESDPTFDSVSTTPKMLSCITKYPSELTEDAIPDLGAHIALDGGIALGFAEDQAAFTGDGSSAYGGVQGIQNKLKAISGAVGKVNATGDTYASVTASDLGAMMGALPARAFPNSCWYFSPQGYGNVLVRLGASGGGLVSSIGPDGEIKAGFLGLPVEITAALPSSTGTLSSGTLMAVCGDFYMGALIAERRQLTIQKLVERFIDTDQVGFILSERIDIVIHDLGTSGAAGAIVGLYAP
jgi:HK97 family phage major capsid protein